MTWQKQLCDLKAAKICSSVC